MPTVNKIAIPNKMNKNIAFQFKFSSKIRPLESYTEVM